MFAYLDTVEEQEVTHDFHMGLLFFYHSSLMKLSCMGTF